MTDITTPSRLRPTNWGFTQSSTAWNGSLVCWRPASPRSSCASDLPDEQVEEDIAAAIALGRRYQARLFINDYWRLAIKHAPTACIWARKISIPPIWRPFTAPGCGSASTHDDAELARALAVKPSYIALGHIFPTQTKDMPSAPQG